MALSKQQKSDVVAEVSKLLDESKITVVANYQGTAVKDLQALRKMAKLEGTKIRVIKNRLVKQAISSHQTYKNVDTSALNSQLLYAFSSEDEVPPAKVIAKFAKKVPAMEFVGAITAEANFISAEEVKGLASLPSKAELIATVINTLNSPLDGVFSGIGGDLHGLLDSISAKAPA